MTNEEFRAWRHRAGFATQAEAANHLGLSVWTVGLYERGHRPEKPEPIEIPRHVALACAAIEHGLSPV